jgi:diaminopimelate decarboxylase
VRLRTANIPSRFGICVDSPDAFEMLVETIKEIPSDATFGVHFHFASSSVGVGQWWHLFDSMLRWCRSLENLTGRKIEVLDIGGGWFPDDLDERFADQFSGAIYQAQQFLPSLREIFNEPGKALAQPAVAVAMRLLEISGEEAVVDGSIAELPMYFFYPHRIMWQSSQTGEWRQLGRGKTHFYGRLCMEHDIVATSVGLPEEAQAGDVLVFFDAGAYDQSMSYIFGQG